MRKDHRPFALKQLQARFENAWVHHFIAPQLEAMGAPGMIMKPWRLHIHGRGIRFGDAVHVVASRDRPVRLTTWAAEDNFGRIEIGDYALLCPAVRIDAASQVSVGANTMLAAGVYITDADWHGIYDRSKPIGTTAPVRLGRNVWLGDSCIVCKGVEIGDNTIVGAGSVVVRSLPANVIAAGNPAAVIRPLDPDEPLVTRSDLLAREGFGETLLQLERSLRRDNSWWRWLRATVRPTRDD